MKPRILILTPVFRPNLGGVETHLTDLTDSLRRHNFETTVLTYQPITTLAKAKAVEKSKNLEIRRFGWLSGNYFNFFVNLHPVFNFLYLTPYLGLRTFIFMLGNHKSVDLIHCIGLSSAFIGMVLKLFFGKPVVMATETLFNFHDNLFSKISRMVLSKMDAVLAQSDESRDELVNLGIDKAKITVFSHWIDTDRFKPLDKSVARKRIGWEDVFTVLYVGRLIPEKGVRIAISAFEKIKNGSRMKIIGSEGSEEKFVWQKASVNPNIDYLGSKSYRELHKYYQAADILIYPALYKEDMAYVLIDSLASGTPVINTNEGSGIYKLSPDCSFVVKPDPQVISEKIKYLIDYPVVRKTMSLDARKFGLKFGPKLAKAITNVYESIFLKKYIGI